VLSPCLAVLPRLFIVDSFAQVKNGGQKAHGCGSDQRNLIEFFNRCIREMSFHYREHAGKIGRPGKRYGAGKPPLDLI
jgi:hypothetical protein